MKGDAARLRSALELVRAADMEAHGAELTLRPLGYEVESVRQALGEARSALERAIDGLAYPVENCPYCAPDARCALHTRV